jgi:autotransporter-associated beta strand protein
MKINLTKRLLKSTAAKLIAAFLMSGAVQESHAVVFLWNNTGTNWTSPTSWTNGVQPASTSSSTTTDEIQFGNFGASNNTVVLTSTRSAQNITFLTNANPYNINSFNGAQILSTSRGITNNSTATQTFNILLENANNSNTWFQTAGGALVFNNIASLTTASSSTSRTLTLAGDGSFTFNKELKQGGLSTAGKVIYTGNGSVTFNGTNTLGGGFDIAGGGTVNVNGGTGVGQALITLGGASGTTNMPILRINTTNGLSNLNSLRGSTSLSTIGTLDLIGNDTNAVTTFVMNQYQGNNMSFTNRGEGKTLLQFTNAANILTSSAASGGGRRLFNNSTNLLVQFDGTMDIGGTVSDLSVIGGQGEFIFNGSLFNTGVGVRGLRKDGTGKVTMQAVNTYNGETIVQDGTLIVNGSLQSPLTTVNNGALLGGSGSLQGVLLNRGTISAGNSAGLLSMNSLDASNGNFIFELGAPSSRGITYDAIDVSSLLTLGTDTDFTFETLNNYVFADGDTYDLFNWGSADMTNFNVSVLEAALPSLASTPDLSWNVSQFTLDGSVSVSIIPEPTALELITMPWQALKALCRMQAEFAEQNPVIATIQTGI